MLVFNNVGVTLEKKEILRDISFKLQPHTLTAVIGKNACGKTTLLSCLTDKSYTGTITFDSKDIRLMSLKEKSRCISVLPQILPTPSISVEELVKMGRNPYLDIMGSFTQQDLDFVEKAIEMTGIEHISHKSLKEISGGERQKAYIAMVLAQNTRVIVLDEPTTYMDMPYEKELLMLLRNLVTQKKKTVMAVMHNITAAVEYAHNIIILDRGEIVFCGTAQQCVREDVVSRIFGLERIIYEDKGQKKILFK